MDLKKIILKAKRTVALLGVGAILLGSTVTHAQNNYTLEVNSGVGSKTNGAVYSVIKTQDLLKSGKLQTISPREVGKVTLKDGKSSINIKEDGVYQVKNIKRAPGYLLDYRTDGKTAQVQFPLLKDGKVSSNQLYKITTKDRPIQYTAEFIKYGDDKISPLEHVTFELRQTHRPKTIADDNTVKEWEEISKQEQDKNKKTYTTKADGKVIYKDLAEGKYQIIETVTEEGYEVNKNENTFTITQEKNKPVMKNSTITEFNKLVNYKSPNPEKKILNDKKEQVDEYELNVETPFQYLLKVKAPTDVREYTKFRMEDTLNDNLTLLSVESITQGSKTFNKDNLVKINGNKLTVDFKDVIKELTANQEIIVTVNAKIKGKVLEKVCIPNAYDLIYNNGKGHNPDLEHKKESNTTCVSPHYGKVEFIKTQSNGTTPLKDAQFKIFKKGAVKSVKEAQEKQAVTNPVTGKPYEIVTTKADGKVEFKNLPYDVYEIWEVKAPQGYNVKNDSIAVTINEKTEEVKLSAVKNYLEEEYVPGTGTKGALIFLAIGTALITTSFVYKKKAVAKLEK